jgi:predicted nucleic acid-binding Zn ribbon protein
VPTGRVLSKHSHCENCGSGMPYARFGQRYCSALCRAEGRAQEQRAAQRLWRAAGRPREDEVAAMAGAAE